MLQLNQEIVYAHIVLNCMSASALVGYSILPLPVSGMHAICCRECFSALSKPCQGVRVLQKESSPSAYASWYPPVQQTLLCLSKLYRCVEGRVFAGLAQDAVSSCTKAVQVRPHSHTILCGSLSR